MYTRCKSISTETSWTAPDNGIAVQDQNAVKIVLEGLRRHSYGDDILVTGAGILKAMNAVPASEQVQNAMAAANAALPHLNVADLQRNIDIVRTQMLVDDAGAKQRRDQQAARPAVAARRGGDAAGAATPAGAPVP